MQPDETRRPRSNASGTLLKATKTTDGNVPKATELRAARPLGLRVLNKAGAALRRLGVPVVRLDPDSLLQAARKSTGLSDFGHDRFREPLERLVDSLESEAQLTILGRMIARRDLLRLLEGRLRHVDLRKQHAEIEFERVERPLFILGMPRTGTSILHELMAQDPQNRVPMSWEVMFPFPPPEAATFETDPRIAEVDAHLSGVDRLIPDFKKMHPMAAQLPQECAAITQYEFVSMIWHVSNRVPGYEDWVEGTDARAALRGPQALPADVAVEGARRALGAEVAAAHVDARIAARGLPRRAHRAEPPRPAAGRRVAGEPGVHAALARDGRRRSA